MVFIYNIIILNFNTSTYATASTLTISVVDSISLNVTPSPNGTFSHSDTSTDNISVSTNNITGYTLSIKAGSSGTNNNALINSSDPTIIIPSITTSGGISENTYSTNTSYNNTWGYRPSKLNSVENSKYLPAPTSSEVGTVLDVTSEAKVYLIAIT